MSATTPSPDGRSTRWDEHRATRREELVEATLRAIRRHGAGVGLDDIAAAAGTSKTVLYRHFTDRAGLHRAVAERVDTTILRDIRSAAGAGEELLAVRRSGRAVAQQVLAAAVDSYLRLVEEDPEIYRFVVSAPLVSGPERAAAAERDDVSRRIAVQIGELVGAALEDRGRSTAPAMIWGYAVVGMVRAGADEWLRAGGSSSGTSSAEVADHLVTLLWEGLSPAWSD